MSWKSLLKLFFDGYGLDLSLTMRLQKKSLINLLFGMFDQYGMSHEYTRENINKMSSNQIRDLISLAANYMTRNPKKIDRNDFEARRKRAELITNPERRERVLKRIEEDEQKRKEIEERKKERKIKKIQKEKERQNEREESIKRATDFFKNPIDRERSYNELQKLVKDINVLKAQQNEDIISPFGKTKDELLDYIQSEIEKHEDKSIQSKSAEKRMEVFTNPLLNVNVDSFTEAEHKRATNILELINEKAGGSNITEGEWDTVDLDSGTTLAYVYNETRLNKDMSDEEIADFIIEVTSTRKSNGEKYTTEEIQNIYSKPIKKPKSAREQISEYKRKRKIRI